MAAQGMSIGRGPRIIGVLDIGTSKIACLIAAVDPAPRAPGNALPGVRVIGVGHQRSRGVKSGVVADLEEAERGVRATIAQAERMASVTLDDIVVSVSCGRMKSLSFAASTDVEAGVVTASDVGRLMAGGRAYAERDGRALIHMNRTGYRLDGAWGMRDPIGMAARQLAASLHAVTADDAPIRNLLLVIQRCHLPVAGLILAPYACAHAATTEEERQLGVTVVDIGGGATTVAVFADGNLVHADAVPVGGGHVTFDIARALQTPLAEAERIKALYGTLVSAPSDQHEVFSYPLAGEDEGSTTQTTKAQLAEIVRPRVKSLVGLVREMLNREDAARYAAQRVVVTGGGSQLTGLAEFAGQFLGCPVRVARPQAVSGLPQVVSSPAFSTVVGLLLAAAPDGGQSAMYRENLPGPDGYLGRVGEWLKSGF